eukprot:tig00021432_g21200.t1
MDIESSSPVLDEAARKRISVIVSNKASRLQHATRLNVFDFDGTLFLTPAPDIGKAAYERATGTPWPFNGWWGRAESLLPPLTAAPGPALPDFRSEIVRQDAVTCMITGRIPQIKAAVEAVLKGEGVRPHFKVFKTTAHDPTTEKMLCIEELCRLFPSIKEVCIWEDQPEFAARFAGLNLGPSVAVKVVLAGPDGCRPVLPGMDLAKLAVAPAGDEGRSPEDEPAVKRRKLAA